MLHGQGFSQCVSYPMGVGGWVSQNFWVGGFPPPPPIGQAIVGDFGAVPKALVKAFCV